MYTKKKGFSLETNIVTGKPSLLFANHSILISSRCSLFVLIFSEWLAGITACLSRRAVGGGRWKWGIALGQIAVSGLGLFAVDMGLCRRFWFRFARSVCCLWPYVFGT